MIPRSLWAAKRIEHYANLELPLDGGRYAAKVLKLVGEGQAYREISHRLGLSKNTVLDIVKRDCTT